MADFVGVQIFDSSKNLVEKAAGFPVLEPFLLHNMVKELTTRSVLHDQEQLFGCFNNFVQLDYVGMSDYLEYLNFSHHSVDVCLVIDFFLFQYFDCYLLLRQQMGAFAHLAKRALSQSFT